MEKHTIPMHPLDELDFDTKVHAILDFKSMSTDKQRYYAEHKTVLINESSSVETCAKTLVYLTHIHIPQLNDQIHDKNQGHHYSNPVELIREESKKREHKKIWLTGNVKDAHDRIKQLNNEIVSEETPKQMMKISFWCLLFGLLFLGLAIYCTTSGAGVDAATWFINATWLKVVFILGTLALSLYFGFFAIGVLLVGGLLILAWIILEMPGLTAFIVNGSLFLVAGILLFVVVFYIYHTITYKSLSEEEHNRNQERIAERDHLKQELAEYSDTILSKLEIMKKKFMDNDKAFHQELKPYFGSQLDMGAVYMIFSFLNKYYRKVKR